MPKVDVYNTEKKKVGEVELAATIFGTEDFVPRKGVMTRYAKKMVRPDMYGLVVVRGLLGESGA